MEILAQPPVAMFLLLCEYLSRNRVDEQISYSDEHEVAISPGGEPEFEFDTFFSLEVS